MKTKLLYIILLFPLVISAQSNDRNWVKQTIYTDENLGNPKLNITYLDGFGRPIQQNAFQQAADDSGTDIITNFEYDDFGRQVKSNLPLSAASNSMLYIDGLTSSVQYPNQDAFSQKEFEPSPLNRVMKISAPGTDQNWSKDSANKIEMQYQANTNDDAVRHFELVPSAVPLQDSGPFVENELYKTVVTDENNNVTQEFKNTKGQLVLKRSFNNETTIDTYYVYDDFGNLIFVIPPKVTDINVASLRDLCYQYHYDAKNRLIEKKVPGKQWEYIVYDALNRIVATGPAYHPFGSDDSEMGWLYNRYDNQNRVVITGWFSGDFSESNVNSPGQSDLRELMQGEYNSEIFNSSRILSAQNIDGFDVYYSIDNYVPSNLLLLSVTYYDDHQGFNTPNPIDFSTPFNNVYYDSSTNVKKPKGLPTCSWVRTLVDRNGPIVGETSYVLYDYRGNPVVSHLFNFKGGYTRTISNFDFGKLVETRTLHKLEDTAPQIEVNQQFDYTEQGLLLRQKHQINDPLQGNAPWVTLAENKYDAMGRLVAKLTGKIGADFLQQIDYQYNIRGWLTGINNIDNLAARPGAPDDAQNIDLFSYKINYDEVDPLFTGATGYFNGNISETYWRTATDNTVRKYSYQYDSLNRMTKAIYQKPDATNPVRDSYNEQVSYDKNGNITSLSRNGDLDINGTTVEIDNMTYQYQSAHSNRLVSLGDGTNSDAGYKDGDVPVNIEYVYDRNGNLIVDKNKQITSIVYNHLNLPTEIIFEGNTNKKITYIYTASGQKVQKAYITPPMTEQRVTNYMGGFQYFKNYLQFMATSEGYVSAVPSNDEGYQYNYVYQYKDHLGNVRLSYGRDTQSPFAVRILEENHYYPYGLKHTNYNLDLNAYRSDTDGRVVLTGNEVSSDMVNKYRFNGMEYQDELGLNLYDMDFRDYDPAIGRWLGIDPVTHFSQSPYNAFDNNPVSIADPSGADGVGGEHFTSVFGMQVSTPTSSGMYTGMADNGMPIAFENGIGAAWGDGGLLSVNVASFNIDMSQFANGNTFFNFSGGEIIGGGFSAGRMQKSGFEWDLNGDNKLSKSEADSWFLYGNGKGINVDNKYIDWSGLKMPNSTKIGSNFSIKTTVAFKNLPWETASTYGGTSFKRTGENTAEVLDQKYHYELRPNNSLENVARNIMNEVGRPSGNYPRQLTPPNLGNAFLIHYLNPILYFK